MKKIVSVVLATLLLATLAITLIFSNPNRSNSSQKKIENISTYNSSSEADISETTSKEASGPEENSAEAMTKQAQITFAQGQKGSLLLVNSDYPLKQGRSDDMNNILIGYNNCYKYSTTNLYMDTNALKAWNELTAAFAEKTGLKDITLVDVYSDDDNQDEAITGLSVSLAIAKDDGTILNFVGQREYEFFYTSGPAYGFIQRFTGEKEAKTGHKEDATVLRYVGVPHAEIMTQKNLCLEEYVEELHKYSVSSPLNFQSGSSKWLIYSIKETDNSTSVSLPECLSYEVSRDNTGYLIITAKVA